MTVSLRKMLGTSGAEEKNDVCICVGVICVWRCSRFSSSHMFLEYIFSSLALPTRCWLHGFPTGWQHCQSGQCLCQVANRFAWMFASQDSTFLGWAGRAGGSPWHTPKAEPRQVGSASSPWELSDTGYCHTETSNCPLCHPCHKVKEGKERALVPERAPRWEAEELDLSTTPPEAGPFPCQHISVRSSIN